MLNIVFQLFTAIDLWIALFLPLYGRLLLWGAVAGVAAMGIYAAVSNQSAIAALKTKTKNLRRQMLDPSLEKGSEFAALAKANLKTSLLYLGKVIGPALLSTLPVLLLAVWLDTYHGYELAEDREEVFVSIVPSHLDFDIIPAEIVRLKEMGVVNIEPVERGDAITVRTGGETIYSGPLLENPVPVIKKKNWWNLLLASQAGYIVSTSAIEGIHVNLARKKVLGRFPDWAAGWEGAFFMSVLITTLAFKAVFKIH